MDIKELNKTQLVLLTLLITFVVSIATGIVTVSLMQQMPKSVPQTINNVIQRTIEKVTTVPVAPTTTNTDNTTANNKDTSLLGDGDVVVSIYPKDNPIATPATSQTPAVTENPKALSAEPSSTPADANKTASTETAPKEPKALGEGIIISDVGLILVDSSILTDKDTYKVTLNKTDFDATILKKFANGFSILKITPITPKTDAKATASTQTGDKSSAAIPTKDLSASAVDSTQ